MVARVALILVGFCLAAGAAGAQQLRNDRAVSPDDTEVLAEGPIAVKIFRTDWNTKQSVDEEVTLLFVTRKAFYARYPKTGEVIAFPAERDHIPKGRVVTIASAGPVTFPDGKLKPATWWRDDKKTPAVYDGSRVPAAPPEVEPLPGARANEINWFLYYALENLQSRVDAALAAEDPALLAVYAKRGGAVAEYMAAEKLDRGVAAGYAGVTKYLDAQLARRKQAADLFAEQRRKRQEAFDKARELQAQSQTRQMLGLGRLFLAAIPDVEEREYSDGSVRRIERYDLGGVASGLGTIYQAQMDYQTERRRLELSQAAFEEDVRDRYARLVRQTTDARKDQWDAVRRIGTDRFGLPPETPLDRLEELRKLGEKAKDLNPVVELLTDRVKRDRGDGPRDNPFALWDLYYTQAMALPAKSQIRGADLFELARKTVAAARLVPPGDIFDFDRTELIRGAASLACTAATAEAYRGSWALAYSPRAAYAVRLFDAIGPLAKVDVTGQIREQRAVALMLTGRADDALTEALGVAELRDKAAIFQVTLARLYGTNPNTRRQDANKGVDALALAFQYGYTAVAAVRNNPDFAPLGQAKNKAGKSRLDDLLRVKVVARYVPPRVRGGNGTVVVVNNSAFALTNVQLRLDLVAVVGPNQTQAVPPLFPPDKPIPVIRADGAYQWTENFNPKSLNLAGGSVTVTGCDQQGPKDVTAILTK